MSLLRHGVGGQPHQPFARRWEWQSIPLLLLHNPSCYNKHRKILKSEMQRSENNRFRLDLVICTKIKTLKGCTSAKASSTARLCEHNNSTPDQKSRTKLQSPLTTLPRSHPKKLAPFFASPWPRANRYVPINTTSLLNTPTPLVTATSERHGVSDKRWGNRANACMADG